MKLELKHLAPYLPYGLKFQYASYNHKEAVKEHNLNCESWLKNTNCHGISDEIKAKYFVNKIGSIRSIQMRVHGTIFKIGAKYPKTFYASEMGIKAKPILRPLSDLEDNRDHLYRMEEDVNHSISFHNGMFSDAMPDNFTIEWIPKVCFEWLVKNHFDVFDLIPSGLAISYKDAGMV